MNKIAFRPALACGLVALVMMLAAPAQAEKRVALVIGNNDYRYVPKDRTAYAAYLRLKRETSALSVWQAQQAYFTWLGRNDPLAAMMISSPAWQVRAAAPFRMQQRLPASPKMT